MYVCMYCMYVCSTLLINIVVTISTYSLCLAYLCTHVYTLMHACDICKYVCMYVCMCVVTLNYKNYYEMFWGNCEHYLLQLYRKEANQWRGRLVWEKETNSMTKRIIFDSVWLHSHYPYMYASHIFLSHTVSFIVYKFKLR